MLDAATLLEAPPAALPLPDAQPEILPRSLHDDALAQAAAWLLRHHGHERSIDSLFAGLPAISPLAPEMALRALREAGFNAGLIERPLAELHAMLMPALLLQPGGGVIIVLGRREAERESDGGSPHYDVVIPGRVCCNAVVAGSELAAGHDGRVLVATPPMAADLPDDELLRDPNRHWLWGTLRRFVPYYRSALLAALLSNLLMLVTGIASSVIFDKVIPNQAFVTLYALAAASATALIFDLLSRQLRAHLIDLAGRKADLIVGAMLFRQTMGVRMESRPESSGAYAHNLAQVETVRDFIASASLSALSDLPFIALFVGMTFLIGGPLGWVLVVAIPCILLMSTVIQGRLRLSMAANMQQQADLHGVLVEAVDGIEDVKAAGAQGRFIRQYEETTAAAADSSLRSRHITAWTSNVSAVAQQLITMVILVWGVHLIDDKIITGGALVGAVMFAGRAVAPLSSVVSMAMRYQGARAAMRALDMIMSQPVEREVGKTYLSRPQLSGRIALQGVSFGYPGPAGQLGPKVLDSVSLQFAPGERVAILGRIGSGKSTILRLLGGLYQPIEGRIEVDGLDLRQIDPADFRARVGFVAQDPRLFHGTLRDNVLLDRATADAGRLAEVARLTGLDRLVAAHPLGWELPVGEAGSLLSGGQRQLVALARCLVTQPQILLMDEPTSSMDAQSETAFLRQLKDAAGHCTLLVVTHRPAVLELVQRVLVIDAGRLVMDGPRDRVLAALAGKG